MDSVDTKKAVRVIICDDDTLVRGVLRARLIDAGARVVGEAENGLKSLNLLMEAKPNLVILDIDMPLGNGLTVLRFMREIDKDIRIVMLTGDSSSNSVNIAIKLGANDFIVKKDVLKPEQDILKRLLQNGS